MLMLRHSRELAEALCFSSERRIVRVGMGSPKCRPTGSRSWSGAGLGGRFLGTT